MAVTTTSSLPPAIQQSLNATLLSVPTADYIYKMPAVKEKMPRNGGTSKRFRRYNPLATFKVPLGNSAVTPPSQNLTALDIDAKIDWYGTWTEISEQSIIQNQEAILQEASLRLGQALRETEDELISEMLASTASQVNAVNGANGDVPTEITEVDVDLMTTALVNSNAHMFLSGIAGEDRYGTAPVRKAYFALCHAALIPDLQRMVNFISVNAYANQDRVLDGEWGALNNARFFVSSIGSVSANASADSNTVYNITFVGKEAYACIEQEGGEAKFIYHPARYSGPLEQSVTAASKFAQVPRILNDAFVGNMRASLS